ncbi:MAG: alanine--glyoxylate aminotransferase family protein [bacterium]
MSKAKAARPKAKRAGAGKGRAARPAPKYRLFTPGPVQVPDDVMAVMSAPLVYHREESFCKLYAAVQKNLQRLMVTKNEVFVLTSSGTGGMEAAVANLVLPNETALIATAGRFGERWRELAIRFGAHIDVLSRPYGETLPPVEVERALLGNDSIKCVFTTLTETSTGVRHDIKAIGEICRRLNRLLVVDAVAGLGADELRMDDWHVDCVVGGSQKAVGVPPGLAFIALSERAWELAARARGTRFYFDLKAYRKYAAKGQTPWTPAISLFYALDVGLRNSLARGVAGCWAAHKRMAQEVRGKLAGLKLEMFPHSPSDALTVYKMPAGVDGVKVIELCKQDGFLFANGQGEMRGKVVRIGHMGPVNPAAMARALQSFKRNYLKVAGRRAK